MLIEQDNMISNDIIIGSRARRHGHGGHWANRSLSRGSLPWHSEVGNTHNFLRGSLFPQIRRQQDTGLLYPQLYLILLGAQGTILISLTFLLLLALCKLFLGLVVIVVLLYCLWIKKKIVLQFLLWPGTG